MSKEKIDPKKTTRKAAFELLSTQIFPCVTVTKTFDVTNAIKQSKKGHKLNIIMNYLIAKAGSQIPEFYFSVDGNTKELFKFDRVLINLVVVRKNGGIAFCDVPFENDFAKFEKDYLTNSKYCFENNDCFFIKDEKQLGATIGTSTIPWTEVDSVTSAYSPDFTAPFFVLTRYRKKFLKYFMPISLQFHHLQMDGKHACEFFNILQDEIKKFKI